jgi:hypothetical protein
VIKTLKVVLMLTCLQGHLSLASRKLLTFASCPDCDSGLGFSCELLSGCMLGLALDKHQNLQ